MAKLTLIRHGESEWNAKGLWTGWTDIGLSDKGREEAKSTSDVIRSVPVDLCFTSTLSRAKETLAIILGELELSKPVIENEALNERSYGDYTGKNKWEIKEKLGDEEFQKLRRSWDYAIPNGESLKEVSERVLPYFQQEILPRLREGKNILIVAHGNSIRTLIKQLEKIPDEEISQVEIKTGEAITYTLDANGDVTGKEQHAG